MQYRTLHAIKLLGAGLEIPANTVVNAIPATNIPDGGIFIRPDELTGIWESVSDDNSIYVAPDDMDALEPLESFYARALDMELECVLEDHPGAKILHEAHDNTGTVALVYEIGGKRVYHAMEYTDDSGENPSQAYGYITSDAHCYMGQRYDIPGLWGPYQAEIFTHVTPI